jgi:hypothetical protein
VRHLPRLTTFAAGLAIALAVSAADEPAGPPPILKPAAPPAGQVRVRIPITGDAATPYRIRAFVPRPKGATGEAIEIVVGINTGARAVATTKMVKSWGYAPGPDKKLILPELILVGQQIAPAPKAAGRDVLARIPQFPIECLDVVAEGTDKVLGSDLIVGTHDLTKHQDRTAEPRLLFTGKLFDMNFTTAMLRKAPGEPAEPIPEPASTADAKLAVVFAPLANRTGIGPAFHYASFNGIDSVKNRSGMAQPVNVGVTAATTLPSGVLMSTGMAHQLGLKLDPEKATQDFVTLDKKGKFIPVVVSEMRVGVMTGKGPATANATPMDLVIKNLEVVVDTLESEPVVWVGPNFVNKYFPDAVYTTAPPGATEPVRLYGRANPEQLMDPKTRKKP